MNHSGAMKQRIYFKRSNGTKDCIVIIGKDEHDIETKFWETTDTKAIEILYRLNLSDKQIKRGA